MTGSSLFMQAPGIKRSCYALRYGSEAPVFRRRRFPAVRPVGNTIRRGCRTILAQHMGSVRLRVGEPLVGRLCIRKTLRVLCAMTHGTQTRGLLSEKLVYGLPGLPQGKPERFALRGSLHSSPASFQVLEASNQSVRPIKDHKSGNLAVMHGDIVGFARTNFEEELVSGTRFLVQTPGFGAKPTFR
jgi:hypothetical protein